jgi:glycosyltransferase involved in cell wall biosynthesis
MNVVHISPVAFGKKGLFGGGERYPWELARAMSVKVPTTYLTFGKEAEEYTDGALTVRVLRTRFTYRSPINPVAAGFLRAIAGADVVHTHHLENLVTDLALLRRHPGRRVFSTDHGGKAAQLPGQSRLRKRLDGLLAVSDFSVRSFPALRDRSTVVFGGVSTAKFFPDDTPRTSKVVYVGRLLPHKGIDVLIEALPDDFELDVYGRSYSAEYRSVLATYAAGKKVTFHENADDAAIEHAYRSARVVVLPSVYRSKHGPASPRAELLGLTLLEAMACGTPVIATDVGGMPEVVVDGQTGYVVPPSDPVALREALLDIVKNDGKWSRMSHHAARRVTENFTWDVVADRCLAAYQR